MTRRLSLPTYLLWPIAALALIGLLGSLVLVYPHDFWWHMKIGQVIATEGGIPQVDHYSFTRPGAPMVYQSWLSELLFYLIHELGGLALMVLVRNLLLLSAYGLLLLQCYRRSGSWRLAAVGTIIAAAMAFNNWSVRPQTFSWVPFALAWTILSGYAAGTLRQRWLLLLPPLELVWANLHGAFTLGLALAGIITAGETITLLNAKFQISNFKLRTKSGLDPALWREQLARVRTLWLTLGAMLLATLLNPRGLGLYTYVITLLTDPSSQQLVVEWQPPAPTDLLGQIFFLSLLAVLVLWLRSPTQGRLSDMLVLLGFTWLALGGVRYVLWYGMVCAPLLVELIARRRGAPSRPYRGSAGAQRLNLLLALLLVLPLVLVQPPLRQAVPAGGKFRGYPELGLEGALVDAVTPLRAAAFLRQQSGGTRMYHDMAYGSYLIWLLGDQRKVFADPRVELYPLSLWNDYRRIAQGCDYNALLEKYQIDLLLLDREQQERLITRLKDDPRWEQIYPTQDQPDERSVIYRLRPGVAAAAGGCGGEGA